MTALGYLASQAEHSILHVPQEDPTSLWLSRKRRKGNRAVCLVPGSLPAACLLSVTSEECREDPEWVPPEHCFLQGLFTLCLHPLPQLSSLPALLVSPPLLVFQLPSNLPLFLSLLSSTHQPLLLLRLLSALLSTCAEVALDYPQSFLLCIVLEILTHLLKPWSF